MGGLPGRVIGDLLNNLAIYFIPEGTGLIDSFHKYLLQERIIQLGAINKLRELYGTLWKSF